MKPKKTTTKQVKTKARKTVAKKPASKEKKMQYTDGKANQASSEKQRLRDLEEVLNPRGSLTPYKARNEDDFDKEMLDMSIPELQSLAVELGVFPSGNKTTLKNKLKKEFKNRHFLGKGKIFQETNPVASYNGMTEAQKKLFNTQ